VRLVHVLISPRYAGVESADECLRGQECYSEPLPVRRGSPAVRQESRFVSGCAVRIRASLQRCRKCRRMNCGLSRCFSQKQLPRFIGQREAALKPSAPAGCQRQNSCCHYWRPTRTPETSARSLRSPISTKRTTSFQKKRPRNPSKFVAACRRSGTRSRRVANIPYSPWEY
jgi:hypothetical protein